MPKSNEDKKDSWFYSENFNTISDEFFDESSFLDFEMEDLEPSDEGENWNSAPEPTMDSFSASSSDQGGQRFDTPKLPKYNFEDEGAACSQLLLSAKASLNDSNLLDEASSDLRPSQPPQTSSPISVLESGNSCSAESGESDLQLTCPFAKNLSAQVRRPRSKRPRYAAVIHSWDTSRLAVSQFYPDISSSKSMVQLSNRKKKKKNLSQLSSSARMNNACDQEGGQGKKCTHCHVTKTPQWREGPLGPKTLCNACGVRYRSGRLLPEYRPAASPSFEPSLHSNSHRKVTEMRNNATQMNNKGNYPENK